jgi:glucose-1-phosphate thymidylyltransferase
MKGIVLAGGTGSRLRPLTSAISKHLLPIYDKPLIFYPISTLMLAGVTDMTVVVSREHEKVYRTLLEDGKRWGIAIRYQVQLNPGGLPQAIALVTEQDPTSSHLVVLGDNIFHGVGLGQSLNHVSGLSGAVAFAHEVQNPRSYGVIELGQDLKILSIEEKPSIPKSNLVIPGLYYFDSKATEYISRLKASDRGELEIVDLLKSYWRDGNLIVEKLQRGTAWFDAGSPEALFGASEYIKILQERQGSLLGSPDEVAWRLGLINNSELAMIAEASLNSSYGRALQRMLS